MAQAELAFGRFRLQAGRQLFLDGQPISLGAKPLNILTALVTAAGDLVTKDELIERVWPGMVVEENAIQAHISAIRKVLGEEARRIATVPGQGYRFCGPVESLTGDKPRPEAVATGVAVPVTAAANGGRRLAGPLGWGLIAVAVLAGFAIWRFAMPPVPKTADSDRYFVLPFVNHTGDARYDTLADTLTDGVGSRLKTQAWDVEIVDRNKIESGKDRPVITAGLAEQLGLAYVIDGSVLIGDGGLQASATIIDAQTGTQIASVTTHTTKHEDVEERQLLVTGLVDQARFAIAREQRRKVAAGKADDNDVRNLLIRSGSSFDESLMGSAWWASAALIDKALELDPRNVHALTVAGAARIQFVNSYAYKDEAERSAMLDAADRFLTQAVSIEPNRAVIHLMTGDLRSAQGRHDAARAEYQRVLELDALNAEAMDGLAMEDIFQGQPAAAVPKLDLAMATNPEDAYMIYGDKAVLQMSLDHDAEALAAARQAVTVESTDPWAWFTLAGLLQLSGQTEEARAALASLRRINPDITIAKLRMGDVNISPVFRKAEERLYAALKDAGMAEGIDPQGEISGNSSQTVASQPK
jgi:DNA-binding winged helix-turn-helix (wHTH) protein/TolB-like protein/tetratricopeptide (TPR) repeat protein